MRGKEKCEMASWCAHLLDPSDDSIVSALRRIIGQKFAPPPGAERMLHMTRDAIDRVRSEPRVAGGRRRRRSMTRSTCLARCHTIDRLERPGTNRAGDEPAGGSPDTRR